MANIRKKKTSSFTSFSNALTQNNDLSFACRGMLVYVLSKPVDWECRPDDIERAGDIGKEARRKIMIEAEKAGYLTFNRIRNKTGQIVCWYDAHEEPVPELERTKSWETPNGKQQPPAGNPEAVNDQPPPALPPAGRPVDGSTASGKPADIIKTEVQSTEDKKQRESGEATENPTRPKLALVSSVGENPTPAESPFSPNDDFSQPAPKQEWTIAERFVLKACYLWDDRTNQESPAVEANWKTKQAVRTAGNFVAARLDVAKRIGGTPTMFLEFWHDTLKRSVAPRPDYVVEQWAAYDRWLIENHETHRRVAA